MKNFRTYVLSLSDKTQYVGILVFLTFCFVYYGIFASDMSSYNSATGVFQAALNDHDHYIYEQNISVIGSGNVIYEMSNDVGIASIFYAISYIIPAASENDYAFAALVFNTVVLIMNYYIYILICKRLKIGLRGIISFFANTQFFYFAQLINKDMLTIFAFLFCVYCGIIGKKWPIILSLPFFVVVRQQLLVFLILFLFFETARRPRARMLVSYVVTSIAAGILSVFASIIGEESLGGGFSSYLISLNEKYLVGYLLFNPLRAIQYILDALASFDLSTETSGIDTAKLLRWPQLLVVILLAPKIGAMCSRFGYWLQTPARPFVLVTVAYFLTWLMNPTINARYVMLITPVLVVFGLYVRAVDARRL